MFTVLVCSVLVHLAAADDVTQVRYDYADVFTESPLQGANLTYDGGQMRFLDGEYNLAQDKVHGGATSGCEIVRWPGGTIHAPYHWKDLIGPQSNRVAQPHGFVTSGGSIPPAWGPDEIGQYCEAIGAEVLVVVSFNEPASNNADLVEYMLCEVDENPNGGTDWASVRASYGHTNPYAATYWEVGNESFGGRVRMWPPWPCEGDDNENDSVQTWGSQARDWWVYGGVKGFTNQKAVLYSDWGETGAEPNDDDVLWTTDAADQKYYVKFPPINNSPTVKIGTDAGSAETWTEESWTDFQNAGPSDKVYYCTRHNGMILFGDGTHGQIPATGNYVFVTYDSGPHDGFDEMYKQMKAVKTNIIVVASHRELPQGYGSLAAEGAGMDGYQMHFLPQHYAVDRTGINYFDEMLGRGWLGWTNQFHYWGVRLMENGGAPDGTEMVVSEYGFGKLTDGVDGSIQHSETFKGGLALGLLYYQMVMRYGDSYKYPCKTLLVNYMHQGEVGLLQETNGGKFRQGGRTHQVIAGFLGPYVLSVVSSNMPMRDLVWYGPREINTLITNDIPKCVPLGTKDDYGNFYAMGINTTTDEVVTVTVDVDNCFDFVVNHPVESHTVLAADLDVENTWDNPTNTFVKVEKMPTDVTVVDADTITFPVAPATIRVVRMAQITSNGVPYTWFEQFGIAPSNVEVAAESDLDGDGQTGLEEYVGGSNPTLPDSAFAIVAPVLAGGSNIIQWVTYGSDDTLPDYRIEYRTNLIEGADWAECLGAVPRAYTTNYLTNVWGQTMPGGNCIFYRVVATNFL